MRSRVATRSRETLGAVRLGSCARPRRRGAQTWFRRGCWPCAVAAARRQTGLSASRFRLGHPGPRGCWGRDRMMVPKVCPLSGFWIEAGPSCPDFKSTAQVLVRLSPGLTKHRAGLVGRSASVVPAASHTDLRGAGSGRYVRDGRGTRSARARRYASTLRTDQTCWAERTAEGEMGADCVGGRQGLVCRCRDVGQESGCRRICG